MPIDYWTECGTFEGQSTAAVMSLTFLQTIQRHWGFRPVVAATELRESDGTRRVCRFARCARAGPKSSG
jgi:hypothetical protein